MRIAEVESGNTENLIRVLRQLISAADSKNEKLFLHFQKPKKTDIVSGAKNLDLNSIMINVGGEQFDYGTFKAAFDTDPRIKTMVKNFDQKGIEPKTKNAIDDQPQGDTDGDKVSQMAKSATDLGDKL